MSYTENKWVNDIWGNSHLLSSFTRIYIRNNYEDFHYQALDGFMRSTGPYLIVLRHGEGRNDWVYAAGFETLEEAQSFVKYEIYSGFLPEVPRETIKGCEKL